MNDIISTATQKLLVCAQTGLGSWRLSRLLALPDFEALPLESLSEHHPELHFLPTQNAWINAQQAAERQVLQAEKFGARILSFLDPDYPPPLAASPDHPLMLYVRGNLEKLSRKSLSITGCSSPTEHGRITAERIASYFSEKGWGIVSSLATVCETFVHEAVLRSNGYAIAILPYGLQTVCPKARQELADRIVDAGGALVSEFPFGQAPHPSLRDTRFKLQTGLTQGLILIQAEAKGHCLTACQTFIHSRRWLAVAYPTAYDRSTNASCIDANMKLADGTNEEKMALLNLDDADNLGNLLILNSRNDYSLIEGRPLTD